VISLGEHRSSESSSLYQAAGVIGIKPTKTQQARVVTIPPSLMEIKLHREQQEENRRLFGPDYRTDLDLIFCTPDGNYRKRWTACDIARRAGLKGIGLHALRSHPRFRLARRRRANSECE
jgi:integrase